MPVASKAIANAIAAYGNVAKGGMGGATEVKNAGGDDFAALVKGAIREAARIGKTAERASVAAVNDKADLNMVVTAVAEAEVTLQTVVAVRDKVLDAYREIMRMPI